MESILKIEFLYWYLDRQQTKHPWPALKALFLIGSIFINSKTMGTHWALFCLRMPLAVYTALGCTVLWPWTSSDELLESIWDLTFFYAVLGCKCVLTFCPQVWVLFAADSFWDRIVGLAGRHKARVPGFPSEIGPMEVSMPFCCEI
jgi:hypothetical protein